LKGEKILQLLKNDDLAEYLKVGSWMREIVRSPEKVLLRSFFREVKETSFSNYLSNHQYLYYVVVSYHILYSKGSIGADFSPLSI
jgi:hypothetical protein